MAKLKPTPELLEAILARIPEGFIRRSKLNRRIKMSKKNQIDPMLEHSSVSRNGNLFFDSRRTSLEKAQQQDKWCKPTLPHIHKDGTLPEKPISERVRLRDEYVGQDDNKARILRLLGYTPGFTTREALAQAPEDALALQTLLDEGMLRQIDDLIFDPLHLSHATMQAIAHKHRIMPLHGELMALLAERPGQTASREELLKTYDKSTLTEILKMGGFVEYNIPMKISPYQSAWIRLKNADHQKARKVALEAVKIKDEAWQEALDQVGDVVRPNARDGKTRRIQVVARSYTVNKAAKRLNVHPKSLEQAIEAGIVPAFVDPEERPRVAAFAVEEALHDPALGNEITAFEIVKVRDLSIVAETSYSTMRRRLQRAQISRTNPRWGDVRGRWNLPEDYYEYKTILEARKNEYKAQKAAEKAEEARRIREAREAERQRREALRARLVNAFPTWQHEDRNEQHITLHIGPPNSGKTHDALNVLAEAGSGWYLAPLRLLAFEVFDRLNQRGIYCNLLTGEEYIPVPGATITAATIEMLNPRESGEVVIIDEAQLLADPDRGWAWTRALMSTQAPEIHVLGPPTAHGLIEKLASEAAISMTVNEHHRLAPIKVADRHWPLDQLPPSTILVAFSRRMVLHLKTVLEQMKRTVSVVYGGLPPEVRRKQADRFASGETEICVATDAVGMGLNLPADYVCFYEVEKFDGRNVRTLYPSEVQQIGGRAGRYQLSKTGEVGATTKRDLKIIRKLFEAEAETLTHARVAPTLQDLELIPGSLYERLVQWSELQSIPDSLRGVIQTADLEERIELARMLTDEEVERLGLERALKIINAPTRKETRAYWYNCTQHILKEIPMPAPPPAPTQINNSRELETTEACIACTDIYLWLSQRWEFSQYGPDRGKVSLEREALSMRIDYALLNKLDTLRRCPECGKPLKLTHRHRLCDDCFMRERFS